MGNVCFKTQGVGQGDSGAFLDDASKFVANFSAREASTNDGDEESALATSGPTTSCSEFYSARIVGMMASRSEFETELEYRTAYSKVHWSELSHPEGASSSEDPSVDHRQYFEKLQQNVHWGGFCNKVTNVVLGRKLGEGAQANIYEAQVTFTPDVGSWDKSFEFVVKLMKGDCALEDLQRQWPHGVGSLNFPNLLLPLYGALVKEPASDRSKFGFIMRRYWGDLRSLIDLRMERRNAKGPPFSLHQAKRLIYYIAHDMDELHKSGIIHKDLKCSNLLVSHYKKQDDIVSSNDYGFIVPYVADWECSVGVVGTGWWRAPEILLQLKNKTPRSKLEFNEKVDVYSFAMTCYEIATGLTPFEGHLYCDKLCDAIINGSRPKFLHNLDLDIRAIITSCWNPNPSLRPSFGELIVILENLQFDRLIIFEDYN